MPNILVKCGIFAHDIFFDILWVELTVLTELSFDADFVHRDVLS